MKTKVLNSCAVTAQLICAFVFTYAKSRVTLDALKLNILQAANINVFCTSQYYKYIYARLTSSLGSVTSFQCLVHLLHHGSTKELKFLPLYRLERVFGVINLSLDKISPPLTEKTMDSKKKLKFKIFIINNYITYFFFGPRG